MTQTGKQRLNYITTDYFTSVVALFLFNIFRYYVLDLHKRGLEGFLNYVLQKHMIVEMFLTAVPMLGIYWLSGYYNQPFGKSRLQELITTFASALLNSLLFFFIFLTNDMNQELSTNTSIISGLFLFLFLIPYLGRYALTSYSIRQIKQKKLSFRTLIIGNSKKAHITADNLRKSPTLLGYDVVGFVNIPGEKNYDHKGFSFLDIETKARQLDVSKIIISPDSFDDTRLLNLLNRLYSLPVQVKIAPATFSYVTYGINLNDIYGEPLIELTGPRISESTKNVKRTMDVIVSALAMMILLPLYIAIGILVKCSSPGPVFYRQSRIGLRRKKFRIIKFRTMTIDAEKDGPALSSATDQRITPIGRFLRKYRLDEIPQFWNVFVGEMSLVGPRPEREFYIRQIVKKAPYYNIIHQVRPGITSWGMVKFGYARNISEMVKRAQFDLVYLQNMSLLVDCKIIIYTIKTVLGGKGM
ncbi:MAG: sugar transferase [Prevotella sp.]|nr:sugar transferase [Bacteroides sp.]MCM1366519.1 sugar transferase [Prevotella sp.]